eukprot:CAMPEP_0176331380 /NCGR_PEP_ID=MMETSP0121_2-20121125/76524_1 /TAXON_ID=160619 /ORGANISM="Kryptoperidinium foliaceum, Strain CCMP 1326" /LENGTH=155 /DNA_ID=CAMNT_0017674231 /DNA_START=116 /DNA_END=581 /DNA_ORIENTATION=-
MLARAPSARRAITPHSSSPPPQRVRACDDRKAAWSLERREGERDPPPIGSGKPPAKDAPSASAGHGASAAASPAARGGGSKSFATPSDVRAVAKEGSGKSAAAAAPPGRPPAATTGAQRSAPAPPPTAAAGGALALARDTPGTCELHGSKPMALR